MTNTDQRKQEAFRLYLEEGLYQREVAERVGVTPTTVLRWMKAEGIEARKGRHKDPARNASGVCADCGKTFEYLPSQRSGTYCSVACRDRHKAKVAEPVNRKCPCGQPVFRPGENTASDRKYCSAECRSKYGKPSKVKDPSKWVTFPCQTCGKAVDRRKSVPGPRKFCSNECATKHTKTVKHYAVRESDMVLDSTWEALFVGQCGWFKVECRRFDREGVIEWRPGQWYGPDFVLPELGVTVEIKGVEDPDDRAKWDAFREKVGPLAVIDKVVLQEIRMIDTREGFVEIVTRVSGS